jgi:MarR family transcriptional regulator, organic hydroperoxide resistance regulator
MPVKFTFTNPLAKTWLLIHQCHRLLIRAENAAFIQVGLTTRKHAVLFALRNLKSPVTVTDVARWLDRNPNGISMLVDRMVKDGLVKRIKDMPDRRAVRLEITAKGERAITAGNKITRQVYKQVFAGISNSDFIKISSVLEKVRFKALDYLTIEYTKEEIQMLKDQSSKVARFLSQGEDGDDD